MKKRALQRLKASLVASMIFLSVLAVAEAHVDKGVSFFEDIFRRSQTDCQEVGSPCWIRSLAGKEDIKSEEWPMDTRRLQFLNGISEPEERAMATKGRASFTEEMRSAEEKPLHGDRLPDVAELLMRSLAAEEDTGRVNAEERAMATRRLQSPEEMRSADEKLAERLHGDRLPEVAAKPVSKNTAVDVKVMWARLDKNIRSFQDERMRKVWQKGSLKHGNRRQQGAPPNTCDGAIEAKTRFDRCVV
jgi:hypothetical protein